MSPEDRRLSISSSISALNGWEDPLVHVSSIRAVEDIDVFISKPPLQRRASGFLSESFAHLYGLDPTDTENLLPANDIDTVLTMCEQSLDRRISLIIDSNIPQMGGMLDTAWTLALQVKDGLWSALTSPTLENAKSAADIEALIRLPSTTNLVASSLFDQKPEHLTFDTSPADIDDMLHLPNIFLGDLSASFSSDQMPQFLEQLRAIRGASTTSKLTKYLFKLNPLRQSFVLEEDETVLLKGGDVFFTLQTYCG
jgi:hypothetical protein